MGDLERGLFGLACAAVAGCRLVVSNRDKYLYESEDGAAVLTGDTLDAVIRNARYLLFAFDGPIRSVDKAEPADSKAAAPASAYLSETLAACRESGRSAAVISPSSPAEARHFLDAHDLFNRIAVVAESIDKVATMLEASAVDCAVITSSPADIEAAQAAGTPSIGYARTSDDVDRLVDAGATTFVYSLAEIVLRIRAHPLPS